MSSMTSSVPAPPLLSGSSSSPRLNGSITAEAVRRGGESSSSDAVTEGEGDAASGPAPATSDTSTASIVDIEGILGGSGGGWADDRSRSCTLAARSTWKLDERSLMAAAAAAPTVDRNVVVLVLGRLGSGGGTGSPSSGDRAMSPFGAGTLWAMKLASVSASDGGAVRARNWNGNGKTRLRARGVRASTSIWCVTVTNWPRSTDALMGRRGTNAPLPLALLERAMGEAVPALMLSSPVPASLAKHTANSKLLLSPGWTVVRVSRREASTVSRLSVRFCALYTTCWRSVICSASTVRDEKLRSSTTKWMWSSAKPTRSSTVAFMCSGLVPPRKNVLDELLV
eukprot:Unigene15618_Nuclearia_a/m.46589 Unigene15618_Nuclearia_a/g.46589  ORF Unigene15618_Nuclearia_a/g.46589 Unigene15618_Nuclearia_a/m.46589 type:complete len:340 (+) Unigene15618_Nuclearia_a:167-1186(+)